VKRNLIVLIAVIVALAVMFWAGYANFEHRKQEQARRDAISARLVPDAATGGTGENPYTSPLLGKPAPAFTLEDLSGKKVSLADYRGKAVMLNFWATWCQPCNVEIPWLIDLRQKYGPQGFEILGISNDTLDLDDKAKLASEKQEIRQFVERKKMSYPILLNGDSITQPYGGVDGLPSSFFVDPSGVIVEATMGLTSKDEVESAIQKALKGKHQG
jgi:peroxiredoxin